MSYFLTQLILGERYRIELTKEEYETIKDAWDHIRVVKAIEDQWVQLVQNYIELELEVHTAAVHHMVNTGLEYYEFQNALALFTRRHFNLLQSCRSYLDHTSGHLRKLPLESLPEAFKAKRSEIYDSSFSYRLMESLRNYAQHEAIPLHGASFDSSWMPSEAERLHRLKFSVSTYIRLDVLREAPGFKKAVLENIDEGQDKLDATEHIRKYLEGLFQVHSELRALVKDDLEIWKAEVLGAINRYRNVSGDADGGLAVVHVDDSGETVEQQPIFDKLITHLERLQTKYSSLVNLSKRYVANET